MLTFESKIQRDTTLRVGPVIATPDIDENYWTYRVKLSDTQAIVGFPKFNTIGIGFAVETNWNSNRPYTLAPEYIYDCIAENKGDDSISREDCVAAIQLIQAAADFDRTRHDGRSYTVMVKWAGAKRAERLANGTTVTRKTHASIFRTREDAELAARQALTGIEGVERWWIATF